MVARVDGRKEDVGAGPRSKDGEMSAVFRQRDNGASVVAAQVWCGVDKSGKLVTIVYDDQGNAIFRKETDR